MIACFVAYSYLFGVERNEGPIQMADVVEKDGVEPPDGTIHRPTVPAPKSPVPTPPKAPVPAVPLPTAPLPSAPLPTAPLTTAPLPTLRAPVPPTPVAPSFPAPAIPKDLSKIDNILESIQAAREEMVSKLMIDYGKDNYKNMFTKTVDGTPISLGRLLFKSPQGPQGPSWDRLRSKLARKLLLVMRSGGKQQQQQPKPRFLWATGGHSSTAGHGNLYDESYTAVLERTVSSVFAAAGMDFVGRNYAMGGTDCAPETAWCVDSIFGVSDPDILVWDHGMTDGRDFHKMLLYFYRGGVNRNRPALIANHLGTRFSVQRSEASKQLEQRGLAAFFSDDKIYELAEAAVPDSLGKTAEEIQAMPKFVRNYRCGNLMENGDPYCGDEKYNNTYCVNRRFKTSWHQGWWVFGLMKSLLASCCIGLTLGSASNRKWHAIQGNLAALFLVEVLEDAAKDIQARAMDPTVLYDQLQQKEDEEYKNFLASDLPAAASRLFNDGNIGDISISDVYKTPCICHTAKVPAEIRHKGILTESQPADMYNYQNGISQGEAMTLSNDSELMRLVRDDSTRQVCTVRLNIDHKDYFFVHEREGWKKLVLPNNAEVAEYGTGMPLRGLIAVCFHVCAWGKCPPGNLLAEHIAEGKGQIEVNGQPVVGMTRANKCEFLRGSQGHYWPPSPESKFEVRVRTTEPDSFIRLGSIVIW